MLSLLGWNANVEQFTVDLNFGAYHRNRVARINLFIFGRAHIRRTSFCDSAECHHSSCVFRVRGVKYFKKVCELGSFLWRNETGLHTAFSRNTSRWLRKHSFPYIGFSFLWVDSSVAENTFSTLSILSIARWRTKIISNESARRGVDFIPFTMAFASCDRKCWSEIEKFRKFSRETGISPQSLAKLTLALCLFGSCVLLHLICLWKV